MKLSILSILLLTSIITIISCSNPTQKDESSKKFVIDTSLLTKIEIAKADIHSFDSISRYYLRTTTGADSIPIKAFTIRAEDLFIAMGIPEGHQPRFRNVRVYLGYNLAASQFKLYIVPVNDGNITDSIPGEDVFISKSGEPILRPQPDNNAYVLDLNAPCPNLCDVHSLLMESPSNQ